MSTTPGNGAPYYGRRLNTVLREGDLVPVVRGPKAELEPGAHDLLAHLTLKAKSKSSMVLTEGS